MSSRGRYVHNNGMVDVAIPGLKRGTECSQDTFEMFGRRGVRLSSLDVCKSILLLLRGLHFAQFYQLIVTHLGPKRSYENTTHFLSTVISQTFISYLRLWRQRMLSQICPSLQAHKHLQAARTCAHTSGRLTQNRHNCLRTCWKLSKQFSPHLLQQEPSSDDSVSRERGSKLEMYVPCTWRSSKKANIRLEREHQG
jgi:hypothetical protein